MTGHQVAFVALILLQTGVSNVSCLSFRCFQLLPLVPQSEVL